MARPACPKCRALLAARGAPCTSCVGEPPLQDAADDPTEQLSLDANDQTLDVQSGDPTDRNVDDVDELSPGSVLERATQDDSISLSVMEREFLEALDGARTLERVAEALAINIRGARRVAHALLARGVARQRGHVRANLTPLVRREDRN